MTPETVPASTLPMPEVSDDRRWLRAWPILLGLAVLAVPTMVSLGKQVWGRESGAHGPIILVTGAWLLMRRRASLMENAHAGAPLLSALFVTLSLLLYVFGRAFDFISIETAAIEALGISILYVIVGFRPLLRNWFPFVYLGFAIPPPLWLIDRMTAPLKQFVSSAATGLLHAAGLPVERQGVTIYVAQYQLLVEDACSGMNSLIGLVAISLLYIYLLRGSSLRYSATLMVFVIPIAIVGNIIRIITLILLTYFFGDQVAQSFLHFAAGIFLFAVDLLLVFAVDSALAKVVPRSWRMA